MILLEELINVLKFTFKNALSLARLAFFLVLTTNELAL